ncbi:uncharacterized protein Tco025E_06483 [Trypanosoma conorhini]|uniref:Uncharacterized protein n=1 Tax=Trypanosoma conorhini TaxID=83891 RepID=A0A3R7KSP1_9TRYP|nr:uncharacterized protein Tco025E_06483 [Trypanosoma conorhini]RNF12722.1 hypothetical protein Tco025E_06483 [Trypanosoma conorhini]
MGRKRAQHIMARLARLFPEQHRTLMREVERMEREARRGGDNTRLLDRCRALLQEFSSSRPLLSYVAQGCPSCLSALLSRAGCCEEVDGAILQLAAAMAVSGTRADTLMDNISKNFAPFVALVFVPDTALAKLACTLLGWAVQLATEGEKLASRLLCDDDFWWWLDGLWFNDGTQASSGHLAASLGLLRACCSVTSTASGAVVSRLRRLCTRASVREEESVRSGALQLLVVLRLTAAESDRGVQDCLAMLTSPRATDVDGGGGAAQTLSEAWATGSDDIPVAALSAALGSLQRDQFDSAARARDLHAIARLLFLPHAPPGMAAALLVLLPGALKTVVVAASGVDENVSACACTILASAVSGREWKAAAPRRQSQPQERSHYKGFDPLYYQNCLVEHFFLLGGVVLLEDLLTDYSNSVVVGALRLLQSLLQFSDEGRNVILASKCIEVLCGAMDDMSQDSNLSLLMNSDDGETALLLALNTITLLGGEAMRLLPEEALACIGTIATEARTNAKVLKAAICALTLLAEAYPLAATLVLDYEYMNSVLAFGEAVGPSELDALYLIGSLNIMAVIVSRQPSSVTLEWIEIIVLASRRLQAWEGTVPGYAYAFWNTLLETVAASQDGSAYLFEDEDLLRLLCASLTRCCQASLATRSTGAVKSGVTANAGDGSTHGEALQLLPLLVRVTRHVPQIEPRSFAVQNCDVVEGVAFLIDASQDGVSPDLLVDTALTLASDEELCDAALDIISQAGPSVVPVLLDRMQFFFASSSTSAPATEKVNTVEGFRDALVVLSGILARSEACHTRATLGAVAGLVTAALRLLSASALPFSLYACLLSLLCKLLRLEDVGVTEIACQLCVTDRLVELLSLLLRLSRGHEEGEKLCGMVYELVQRLYEAQAVSSSSILLQDKVFLSFAKEHIPHDSEHPSCRSLFMRLSAAPGFQRQMFELHEELFRAVLTDASADAGGESRELPCAAASRCDAGAEGEKLGEAGESSGVAEGPRRCSSPQSM